MLGPWRKLCRCRARPTSKYHEYNEAKCAGKEGHGPWDGKVTRSAVAMFQAQITQSGGMLANRGELSTAKEMYAVLSRLGKRAGNVSDSWVWVTRKRGKKAPRVGEAEGQQTGPFQPCDDLDAEGAPGSTEAEAVPDAAQPKKRRRRAGKKPAPPKEARQPK